MRSVPSQLRSQLWCGALKGRGSHHGECFKDIRPATVWWRSGGWSCIAAYAIGRTSRLLWLNCNESHDERTSSRQPGADRFRVERAFSLAWADENSRAGVAAILCDTARCQFEEEIGFGPVGKFLPLGSIRQKCGKIVHAWAFQGDCADSFVVQSEPFEMEWPPRSGRILSFPEIDRGEFFPLPIARQK